MYYIYVTSSVPYCHQFLKIRFLCYGIVSSFDCNGDWRILGCSFEPSRNRMVMLVMFDFAIPHFADSRILTCFQPMLLPNLALLMSPGQGRKQNRHQPITSPRKRHNPGTNYVSSILPPGHQDVIFRDQNKLSPSPQADLHEKLWAAVRHGGCDGFLEIPKTRRSGFPAISRICHGFHEAGINPCKSCMELAWQSPPFQDVQVRC